MKTALEVAMQRTPKFEVPRYFGYAPPVSQATIDDWQSELDRYYDHRPCGARVVIYWEPGDPWQPIRRWFLGQAVDPRFVTTEPWIVNALQGPNPRSTGHYCANNYCLCDEGGYHPNRRRWVNGASKLITGRQWRMYRETGMYVTPWWVIQGPNGGHRYRWENDELACVVSQMKGFGSQPPAPTDLPYAPFDGRVMQAIRKEWVSARILRRLEDRKENMKYEERDRAEAIQRHLWDWAGKEAELLWSQGGDAIPIVLEQQYGRAPVGHQIDFAAQEVMTERALTVPIGT